MQKFTPSKVFRGLFPLVLLFFILGSTPAAQTFQSEPTPTPETAARPDTPDPNHLAGRDLDNRAAEPGWLAVVQTPGEIQIPQDTGSLPVVATAVATGLSHTCALTAAGGVRCWGDNYLGQLGDGATQYRMIPGNVLGLTSGVTQIGLSHKHTCALLASGGVRCWGYNRHGEQGDGTTVNNLFPQDVSGLTSGVVQIAVGGFHTCALMSSGGVKCWGANWHGQLGDGSTTQRLLPVNVVGLNGLQVTAITAGKFHTCALVTNGGVKCWGYNKHGEQGNGTTVDQHTPGDVEGLTSGVIKISPGGLHSCALRSSGAVVCWGDNLEGQLGDGSRTQRLTPVNVSGLSGGIANIYVGAFHSCALTVDDLLKCWGDNWAGQIGDGSTTDRLTPASVAGLPPDILSVSGGDSHSCAVTGNGQVLCWGSNSGGQLGDGTNSLRLTPVTVINLGSGVLEIYAGARHTCALTGPGGVKCWGNNKYGQLGDGTTVDRLTPVDVAGLTSGVTALGVGYYHTCAVTGGGVKCWGDNGAGQLGDGTTDEHWTPIDVDGLTSGVEAVSAGSEHSCALTGTGGVYCWGSNSAGRLGNSSTVDSLIPVQVAGLASGVEVLDIGESHSCVVTQAGGLKCWGYNHNGQLGVGSTTEQSTPVDVVGLTSGVSMVSASSSHTCAVNDQGGVKCWGANSSGEVGDGTHTTRLSPVQVLTLSSGVTGVNTGNDTTCASLATGGIQCWGNNTNGQLGDGTTESRSVPGAVSGISGTVTAMAGGGHFACAKVSGMGPQCWGTNGNGQLGDGTVPWQTVPGEVIGLTPATLAINYGGGQPGSFFTVTGTYFLPLEQVAISINGHPMPGTIISTDEGNLSFLISTAQADEGDYFIKAEAILIGYSHLSLDTDLLLRPQESTGLIMAIPPGIAYAEHAYLPAFKN